MIEMSFNLKDEWLSIEVLFSASAVVSSPTLFSDPVLHEDVWDAESYFIFWLHHARITLPLMSAEIVTQVSVILIFIIHHHRSGNWMIVLPI